MSGEENRIIPYETAKRIFELADVLTGRAQGVYENQLTQIAARGDHDANHLEKALVRLGTTPEIAREAIRAYSMSLDETLDIMERVNGVISEFDATVACGKVLLQKLQEIYPTERFTHGQHKEYSSENERHILKGNPGELYVVTETFHAVPSRGLRRFLRKRAGEPLIDTESRTSSKMLGQINIEGNRDQNGQWKQLCTIRVYDHKLLRAVDHKKATIERVLRHTQNLPRLKTEVSMRNR